MSTPQDMRLKNAEDACASFVDLFEGWQKGIFKDVGVTWQKEPPAIIQARAVLAAKKGA